jgi:hypothetical protein
MIVPNTVNVCVTGVAAGYVELPAWLAVIEHVPPVSSVAVTPDAVHTPVDLDVNATANPEVARRAQRERRHAQGLAARFTERDGLELAGHCECLRD